MWLSKYLEVLAEQPLMTVAATCVLAYWSVLLLTFLKVLSWGYLWEFWSSGKVKDKYQSWLFDKLFYIEVDPDKVEYDDRYLTFKANDCTYYWTGSRFSRHSYLASYIFSAEELKESRGKLKGHKVSNEYSWAIVLAPVLLVPIAWVCDWLFFNAFLQTLVVMSILAIIGIVMFGGRYMYGFSEKLEKLNKSVEDK